MLLFMRFSRNILDRSKLNVSCKSKLLTIASVCFVISGYNFVCDIKQLAYSYEELSCFKHYEKLLDIQNIFKEHRGGLSGLAEVFKVLTNRDHTSFCCI